MNKDYYKILGVDKGASQDEIKKAFRKLAHQHHPDKKGGNEAKFKEINEAYQVLGDEKKRSQYDQFGSAFGQSGGFSGFGNYSDFANGFNINVDDLGDIFGGIGDIFGFSSAKKRGRTRGRDIEVIIDIPFMDAAFGIEKEIRINKKISCDKCNSSGAEPGSKIETCSACGGTGKQTKIQRTILGNVQVASVCENCGGEGKKYSKPCSKCRGEGVIEGVDTVKIKIPAGIDNNEAIRYRGMGEAGEKGAPAGDLYVKIRVLPDPRFRRDGYDVLSKKEISFTQAVLGDKIEVETIDGPVFLKIPAGTQSGKIFILNNKGITKELKGGFFNNKKRGNHLIEIIVNIPKTLNSKQKKFINELKNTGI